MAGDWHPATAPPIERPATFSTVEFTRAKKKMKASMPRHTIVFNYGEMAGETMRKEESDRRIR